MSNVIIPTSPEDLKRIGDAVTEICDSMTRIQAERDLIKEIVDAVSEKVQIPKKILKKMATIHFKQSLEAAKSELDDVETMLEATKPKP